MTGRRVPGLPESASRPIRFGAVAVYNTAFAYLSFAAVIVVFPGVPYLAALLVAHVLGVLNAYTAHRLVVFRVRGRVLLDLARFWAVSVAALGLNAVLLTALVQRAGMGPLPAELVAVALTGAATWVGHTHFSFRRPAEAP